MTRASQLRRAMRSRKLVRITRPLERGWVHGYVLAVGRQWFVLAVVTDQVRFDGCRAFRLRDVRTLREDPYAPFVASALRKRRVKRPRKPKVSIRSLRELLSSAGRSFPLVTIHREILEKGACHIGRIVSVTHARVSFLRIGPDAVWDRAPTNYALKDITCVEVGGDYEDALHIVGGAPSAH
jgi:hypothetical protein